MALMGVLQHDSSVQGRDMILTGHTDNKIRLWDQRLKKSVSAFRGHKQWIHSVTWCWREGEPLVAQNTTSPLNPSLDFKFVSGSEDGSLKVWDLRSLSAPLLSLEMEHTDGVLDVTYVGQDTVASAAKDNTLRTTKLFKGGDLS
eukprot:gene22701-166_t